MIKNVLYIIVISLFIFFSVGLFLPASVHVERSVVVDRPAATVFTLLNGFSSYRHWSPWLARDPEAAIELSGPESGPGARLEWSGDPRLVGTGWQEIRDSSPPLSVSLDLQIDHQGRALLSYRIQAEPPGVRVTWAFDADLAEGQGFFGGLLARYFGLFFDQWIGGDFEQGLQRLKTYAESLPETDFLDLEVEVVQASPVDILYVAVHGGANDGGVTADLESAYREITDFMKDQGIARVGQPMAISRAWDDRSYEFDAAIPIAPGDWETAGNVRLGRSPAGRAVRVVHIGPYERMVDSYGKLAAWMAVNGYGEGRVSWEHYISDPGTTPPAERVTHIYFLIAEPAEDEVES